MNKLLLVVVWIVFQSLVDQSMQVLQLLLESLVAFKNLWYLVRYLIIRPVEFFNQPSRI